MLVYCVFDVVILIMISIETEQHCMYALFNKVDTIIPPPLVCVLQYNTSNNDNSINNNDSFLF